jgi:hypothetical protein
MNEMAAQRIKPDAQDTCSDEDGGDEDRLIADCEALISAAKRFFSLQSPYHLPEAAGADVTSLEAERIEQLHLFEPLETLLVKTAATAAATNRCADAKRRAIEVSRNTSATAPATYTNRP